MKLSLAPIAIAAAGLAACAEPPPPGPMAAAAPPPGALAPPMCFRAMDIRNHTLGEDAHTVYLNVRGRAVYRVVSSSACLSGATPSDPIITRQPPGSEIICRPIDLDLSISKGGFPTTCIVQSITPLTPAEVAALPPRMRP